MSKFLDKLNSLAKKGSGMGGKLGIIARAVDAVIPDATSVNVKTAKAAGDTNAGEGNTFQKSVGSQKSVDGSTTDTPPAKKSFKEMWAAWPMYTKIGVFALPVGLIIWMMSKKKSHKRRY